MTNPQRKIIHIDMDCFYAAVEIRDNPSLVSKAVAVGGAASARGVLCTCNYIARSFGLHSAMATSNAMRLCPELVLLPVNMAKYKAVSQQIQAIFKQFTVLVEPLSLDEAYLDVTNSQHNSGSATLIAEAIRHEIWQTHQLTASAGVAANKFLAKIASGWNKPNGT
jgi:DNA polymerase-4